jgi:hypothetical protein
MAVEDTELKRLCTEIVGRVEPDNAFVVEDNFDALRRYWNRDEPRAEGQLTVPDLVVTFASVMVPFLAGFMLDVAKDTAKALIVDKLKTVLKSGQKGDEDAKVVLQTIIVQVDASGFSAQEKQALRDGFSKLLK